MSDNSASRQSTGLDWLDAALGGGLIPGTLTVVLGATGIGKTQFGLSYANAGTTQEGERGVVFDLTTRGDAQNHDEYASRLCNWPLRVCDLTDKQLAEDVWNFDASRTDYAHIFSRSGRRVTVSDLDTEQWQEFRADLMKRLDRTIGFFYSNFVHGVRRCVIDGVEPTDRDSDSFQHHVIDYVYHQILLKEHDWLARDLFRAAFRQQQDSINAHAYDHTQLGCLLLQTSHEMMLDHLIERPLMTGDVLSNANTVILMGKTREGSTMGRALVVAKHRGSACEERILPYRVTETGLEADV